MSASKAEREAREALTEAKAELAAKEAEHKVKMEAAAKARAIVTALEKKLPDIIARNESVGTVQLAGNQLRPSWWDRNLNKPKDLVAAILAGEVTFGLLPGSSWKWKGLVHRVRVPDKAGLARIAKMRRKYVRAQDAAVRATIALNAEIREVYDASPKIAEPEALAKKIAMVAIKKNEGLAWDRHSGQWELERLTRTVAQLEMHLTALRTKGECGCDTCLAARHAAARQAERQAAFDALPERAKLACPKHGNVIGKRSKSQGSYPGAGWRNDWPVIICPRDFQPYIDKARAEAVLEAERKARKEKVA